MKSKYAQLSMQDAIWDEETSPEELAETKRQNIKNSIKEIKSHRFYKTYDEKEVYLREFVLLGLFDDYIEIGRDYLSQAYDEAISDISGRVKRAGFDAPILEIPYVLKQGGVFPNRLHIVELVGEPITRSNDESRLIVTRVTDSFEGVIEKEISDIVGKLNWCDLAEDFEVDP